MDWECEDKGVEWVRACKGGFGKSGIGAVVVSLRGRLNNCVYQWSLRQ